MNKTQELRGIIEDTLDSQKDCDYHVDWSTRLGIEESVTKPKLFQDENRQGSNKQGQGIVDVT